MKFNFLRYLILSLILLFFMFSSFSAISAESSDDTSISSKTFRRNLKQIDIAMIDRELLKISFIDLTIKSYTEGCVKTNPNLSLKIAATGDKLFKDHPKWTGSLMETEMLWKEVNTLTDEAGTLSDKEIGTLNMIAGTRSLLRNNTEMTSLQCSGFLRNLEDVSNRETFWDNYLKQAIPIIVTYS